ncbi:hypothetical protein Nepgr_015225 [Nepenthes gracilis]|uniref:Uncharacterized protein n=1 Tax=Nepenthes gracilis TaxID=150966 RepID=A0AAD3SMH6_NEPGR|nr:hypothetical protein Nepgr_015225 [Nepenthes gracilis]
MDDEIRLELLEFCDLEIPDGLRRWVTDDEYCRHWQGGGHIFSVRLSRLPPRLPERAFSLSISWFVHVDGDSQNSRVAANP